VQTTHSCTRTPVMLRVHQTLMNILRALPTPRPSHRTS
jgi:hypothetical protein